MRFLNCLVLLATLTSCGSQAVKTNIDNTAGYRTSGLEQFFLPELPQWANFSSEGRCYKSSSFMYLNFLKLKEAYQLDYHQMVELQAQYNEKLENYFRSTAMRFLKPMEEASFFSNTLEQVRGGVRSLKLPEVKEVEVIWLEALSIVELKKLAKSERFNERLPILFSSCHSKQSLTQLLSSEEIEDLGTYSITAEWLSPYSSEGELKAGLHIELSKLLGNGIKIIMSPVLKKTTNELLLP